MNIRFALALALSMGALGATGGTAEAIPVSSDSATASAETGGLHLIAASTEASAATAYQDAAPDSGWEFGATAYGWLSGMKVDIDTPQGESIAVDKSFGDILDVLKFTFMGAFEQRNGRFVMVQDLIYLSTESNAEGSLGPGIVEAEVDQKLLSVTLLGGYRAVDKGPLFLDLMAGGRITTMKINVDLSGPLMEVERDTKETRIAPVIATRFHAPLGGKWGFGVYGDLGSFGVVSDLSWQLMANIHYQVSDHWVLGAGWRHFEAEQAKEGFKVDLAIDGPFLGASYRF